MRTANPRFRLQGLWSRTIPQAVALDCYGMPGHPVRIMRALDAHGGVVGINEYDRKSPLLLNLLAATIRAAGVSQGWPEGGVWRVWLHGPSGMACQAVHTDDTAKPAPLPVAERCRCGKALNSDGECDHCDGDS